MSVQNERISFFAALLLIYTSVGLQNHVIIIPALLDVAGRDAWLAIIVTVVTSFVWIPSIYFISRRTNQQNMYVWMKDHMPTPVRMLLVASIFVYLVFVMFVSLRYMVFWTHITYLTKTPQILLLVFFMLICVYLARTSLLSIAIVNFILLPLVVLLGIFVMTANFPNKDYTLLLPILEHGMQPLLLGMVYAGAGIVELFIILLLQHHIKGKMKLRYLFLITVLIGGLAFGPVTGAIAAYGPEGALTQRFPAYEQWRLVSVGRYIENMDFFSVYQWLSGGFIRISLALFLLLDLLKSKNQNKNKSTVYLLVISSSVIFLSLLPYNDILFLQFIKNIYLPVALALLLTLSIMLSLALMSKSRRSISQ